MHCVWDGVFYAEVTWALRIKHMLLRARIVLTPASIKLCAIAGYRLFHALSCTAHFIPIMQSSVYATCTDWNFFSGNPLFIAARCRFTFTYSTVPVGGICRSFTMLQKELFVRGSPFQIRAICYAVQDLCTHVGLPFTCCKKTTSKVK